MTANKTNRIEAILYTKPGCCLCDDVKAVLYKWGKLFPHTLREVDIGTDPALDAQFALIIPVLRIDNTQLNAPILPDDIIRALRTAHQKNGRTPTKI